MASAGIFHLVCVFFFAFRCPLCSTTAGSKGKDDTAGMQSRMDPTAWGEALNHNPKESNANSKPHQNKTTV